MPAGVHKSGPKKGKLKKGYKWSNGRAVKATGAKKKASKKKKKKRSSSRSGGAFCPKAPKGMRVGSIRKIRRRYWKKVKGGKLVKSSAEAARKHKAAQRKKAGKKAARKRRK